jgi:hypothetical protein
MDGVDRVLYRLPQVIAAVLAKVWIFLVEGEKDVHTLEALGKVATTNVGGAGETWTRGYTDTLRGAKVVLIPDMDIVGTKRGIRIANAIGPHVAQLKIYCPLEPCKDITEHLEAGHSLNDLVPFGLADLAARFNLPERPEPRRREPERPLHIVTDEGEIIDESVVTTLRDQLAGAEKEIRAWRQRFAELKRDKDAAAREDESWPTIFALFKEWGKATGHTRSRFDSGRFYLALPFLRNYGELMFRCAIHGIATDPFTTTRANGTPERQDGWETMLKNTGSFERYCNRAPLEMLREARKPKRKRLEVVPDQDSLTAEA